MCELQGSIQVEVRYVYLFVTRHVLAPQVCWTYLYYSRYVHNAYVLASYFCMHYEIYSLGHCHAFVTCDTSYCNSVTTLR